MPASMNRVLTRATGIHQAWMKIPTYEWPETRSLIIL